MSLSEFRPIVVIGLLMEKVLPASGPVQNMIAAGENAAFPAFILTSYVSYDHGPLFECFNSK